MSCSKCFEKFSLFKKEIGCTKCGFSICTKCSKKHNKSVVCVSCFDKLNNSNEEKTNAVKDDTPPENFLKMRKQNEDKIKKKATSVDDELSERLKKLNDPKNKQESRTVNDDELQTRLNNLMQINPNTAKLSNLPTKSIVNTADDLIKQMTEETSLDKKMEDFNKNTLNDLEVRVKKLLEPYPGQEVSSTIENEEVRTKQQAKKPSKPKELMKKLLSEAESNYKNNSSGDEMDKWCTICNDDGDFKCIDCDNDVYCKRCFKECHDKYEYKTHRRKDL